MSIPSFSGLLFRFFRPPFCNDMPLCACRLQDSVVSFPCPDAAQGRLSSTPPSSIDNDECSFAVLLFCGILTPCCTLFLHFVLQKVWSIIVVGGHVPLWEEKKAHRKKKKHRGCTNSQQPLSFSENQDTNSSEEKEKEGPASPHHRESVHDSSKNLRGTPNLIYLELLEIHDS